VDGGQWGNGRTAAELELSVSNGSSATFGRGRRALIPLIPHVQIPSVPPPSALRPPTSDLRPPSPALPSLP
jgi:hypothetical protein